MLVFNQKSGKCIVDVGPLKFQVMYNKYDKIRVTAYVHSINNVLQHREWFTGLSKVSEEDEFDLKLGGRLACLRAVKKYLDKTKSKLFQNAIALAGKMEAHENLSRCIAKKINGLKVESK